MRNVVAALVLVALGALRATAAAADDLTLVLPHPLRQGEMAWIEVQVGPIGRREINVATAGGRQLGTISPFGVRFGQDAGTYTVPVPPDAIHDGRVTVRLTISQPGAQPRAPTATEVHDVKLLTGVAPH
jgi:hypothetical protein